jgi:hypothetical protein
MSIITIFVLWTWGLTPLWVNITGTVILGLRMILKVLMALIDAAKELEK